jgi:hypothetical protein
MEDTMLGEKSLKLNGGIFTSSSIRLETFDFASKLILNKDRKFNKTLIDIWFIMNEIKPGIEREIIYKIDIVFIAT